MENTKHGGLRVRPTIIDEIHEAWARENGYRDKAPSPKRHSLKRQASSSKRAGGPSGVKLLRRSLTRALDWDIVGVRVRPEMARQSIYVEVHLWARAIAPPRSCSNDL